MVFLAGAGTSNGPLLRLYLLPGVTAGRLSINATATASQPLGGSGVRQASIDPLTTSVRLGRGVKVGAATVFSAAAGRELRVGAGPAAQFRVAGASLSFALLRRSHTAKLEARASLNAAF